MASKSDLEDKDIEMNFFMNHVRAPTTLENKKKNGKEKMNKKDRTNYSIDLSKYKYSFTSSYKALKS